MSAIANRWTGVGLPANTEITAANVNTVGNGSAVTASGLTSPGGTIATEGRGIRVVVATSSSVRRIDATVTGTALRTQCRLTVDTFPTGSDSIIKSVRSSSAAIRAFILSVSGRLGIGGLANTTLAPAVAVGDRVLIDFVSAQAASPTVSNGRVFFRVVNLSNPTWNGTGDYFYDSGYTLDVGTVEYAQIRFGKVSTTDVLAAPGLLFEHLGWETITVNPAHTSEAQAKAYFADAPTEPVVDTPPPTIPPSTFRRAPGGSWEPGWFMPGVLYTRRHPDTTWTSPGRPPLPGGGDGAHVIVGLIQSNIRGAANDWDASDQYNNPLIEMWRWSDGKLVQATEPLSTRDTATGMGAMNTFVKAYAAANPGQRIVVVNTARGGTGLTLPATNPAGTAFTWDPNAANDANNLARTSVTAINSIMAGLPSGSKIVAFLANHGSTDGSNGTTKDTFKTLLANWITFLRAQTNTPTVPYLMLQMRPSLLAENRHNIIDQGQQEVAAATPNVEHVPAPVGTEYANNDSVHFNARGVREIGSRLYQRFASLAGTPEAVAGQVVAGAVPLGSASYPIVGEARYVATGGSNSAAGTQAAPWATLAHAITNTPTGGTIVLRGGVHYTGSLSTPSGKTLRIMNQPGEAVWLDGTQEFTGWTSSGDGTWSAPYSITFQRATPYAGTNPLRNHPDQVWLDATQLTQVADGTTPGAGQFSVNQTTDRLTIGSNPSGKIVRASVHNTLLVASGRVDLLGIGVRRYSPETMEFLNSMIYYGGTAHESIIENCHFRESHMAAVSLTKNDMRVSSNTFEDCGHAGVHAAGTVGLVFEKNVIRRVNRQGWQAEPTVAGIKIARTDQVTVRHNVVYDVAGTYGIWLDVSVTRFNVHSNHVHAGSEVMKHGIEAELSDGGKYAGVQHRSYIVGNNVTGAKVGVLLYSTGYTTVANNDLRGNEIGFQVWQDSRYNDESTSNNRTFEECPWIARANESINNAYQTTGGYNIQLIAYDDGGRHNLTGLDMLTRIAGDWYNTAPPGAMVQLGRTGGVRTSYNTPALLAAAGSDVGGPIGSKLGTVGQSSAYPTAAQMEATAVPASAVVAGMLGVPVGARLIGPNVASLPVVV